MGNNLSFSKKISVKAMVLGGIVDVVGTNIWGVILGIYLVSSGLVVADYSMTEQLRGVLNINQHPLIFVVNLLMGGAFSVIGGYVAASIAKHDQLINGALSSFLCVGLGIYGIAIGMNSSPLVFQFAGLLVSSLLGLLGGYIKQKRVGKKGCQVQYLT